MASADQRICRWCRRPIRDDARSDSIYCAKRCRQAAHRFARGCERRETTTAPRRFGFADPPYVGLARRYYRDHPDYAGEVDHGELVERLIDEFDGWALSCSATSVLQIWKLCPDGTKLAPWVRGSRGGKSYHPNNAWEAVLYFGDRPILTTDRVDALVHTARPRTSDPARVVGAKPAAFCWWLFDLLGALPGDVFVDLFPGSGGVARAWNIYNASQLQERDMSPAERAVSPASRDTSCVPGRDASRRAAQHASHRTYGATGRRGP